jgi:hypothetical protein
MWLVYGGLGVGRWVLSTIDDIQALKIKMDFFELKTIQFSANTWSVPDYPVYALLLCCFSDCTIQCTCR